MPVVSEAVREAERERGVALLRTAEPNTICAIRLYVQAVAELRRIRAGSVALGLAQHPRRAFEDRHRRQVDRAWSALRDLCRTGPSWAALLAAWYRVGVGSEPCQACGTSRQVPHVLGSPGPCPACCDPVSLFGVDAWLGAQHALDR